MIEVNSFMGLVSYYHGFVKNFVSIITQYATNQKEVPFIWSDKCEKSFQKLKTLSTTISILSLSVEGISLVKIQFCLWVSY